MLAEQKVVGSNPVGCTNLKLFEMKKTVWQSFLLYNFCMNEVIFKFFGTNEIWSKVTDILIAVVIGVFACFFAMGVYQWIKRKSLKKVDAELLCMIPCSILIAAIYVIFAKFCIVGYRPILIDGVAEPSFPSSHTLVAVTLLGMMLVALPKYIKKRGVRVALGVLMALVALVIGFGRMASGMHWFTDVMGGLIFGVDLVLLYGIILKITKERQSE